MGWLNAKKGTGLEVSQGATVAVHALQITMISKHRQCEDQHSNQLSRPLGFFLQP